MINHLFGYRVVAVVGPNRSGTRLVAQALAHDMRWDYVDELAQRFAQRRTWATGQRSVFHATAATHLAHTFGSDVAVVFVHRPNGEILDSMQRMRWTEEVTVRRAYRETFGEHRLWDIPRLQKEVWVTRQRPFMPNAFDVAYYSFSDHPLWVEDRVDFDWNQTCR